ncbi:MAG: signal peptidase II [bacterium]|nr:signal peptidase II [bacterium]
MSSTINNKKNYIIGFLIIAVSVFLDIISKNYIVNNYVEHGPPTKHLGGFLHIHLVYNRGGVFGIGQGYKNIFLILSIVVLALMIGYYIYEKNKSTMFTITMSLIVSGAIGNILDRLIPLMVSENTTGFLASFYDRKGVVDFISVDFIDIIMKRWPSFNVADSVVVVGAFLLVIVFYKEEKKRKEAEEGK